ncbi:T9SS type A sorting domain-containing protein [Leptobacterium flavescens]|uniref:T9SS type A sorting domain-containing protein n=1 Tax=Leptobacterium flavescens TaxID=472055 RepID=A0A6P0UII9_9FLAO|nr:zinc-dependent metalloprotease [Leptobacterium flavescens]NER12807.1 T9SS type A sorting domain-containing protein [Leptobacterium flavescens]
MKPTKQFLMLLLTVLTVNITPAQEIKCKSEEATRASWLQHPEIEKEFLDFNNFSKQFINTIRQGIDVSGRGNVTYTIPVVFHVYGTTQNGETVNYNTILNSIEQVNEEFQGLNADFNTVDPRFSGIRGTMSIEFKLATIDPDGNPTNGVVFHAARGGYGNNDGGTRAAVAADAWDNYKYMNVYIQADLYNDGVNNNSGIAWLPSTYDSDRNNARVVYNGRYLTGNTSREFASVLTHEFGHWLNLRHTHLGGCGGDDFVADTPQEDTPGGKGCSPSQNCNGQFINYENYMGYNGGSGCYKMFTQGQVERMLAALQHQARITLWQEQNLIDTGVRTDSSTSSVDISPGSITEAAANDGSFDTNPTITASNTTFKVTGTLVEGTHYSYSAPQGLSAQLVVNDDATVATVSFSGTADDHQTADNFTGNFSFTSAAVEADESNLQLNFVFRDNDTPPQGTISIIPSTHTEATANDGSFSSSSTISTNNAAFKLTGLLTEGTHFTASVPEGLSVRVNVNNNTSATLSFTGNAVNHEEADRFSGNISFTTAAIEVADPLLDLNFEFRESEPDNTNGVIAIDLSTLIESEDNDGSFSINPVITASNTTFKTTGVLSGDTHYTYSIPEGLNMEVKVNNDATQAVITFSGNAINHEAADNFSGSISFTTEAIDLSQPSVGLNFEFLDAETTREEFILFPNPFKEQLTLQSPLFNNDNVTIEVYNLRGQKIYDKLYENISGELQMDTNMNSGLYFARILINGRLMETKRILKQ